MLAVGPNGAGKTNLLESLHLAVQGFSPRTRADAQLIRFGEAAARVAIAGEHGGAPTAVDLRLRLGEAKRARLNGAPLRAAEELRSRLPALVFTPEALRHLAAQVGPSQLVMGSDFPFPCDKTTVDHILKTPELTDAQRAAILGGTAARLLKINGEIGRAHV